MNSESIFSSTAQLMEIGRVLSAYMRLPLSSDTIPGGIMEVGVKELFSFEEKKR